MPDSPKPKRPEKSKKFDVPTIDLSTAQRSLARTNQEDRREKIKENFGKKFEQASKKEEEIGAAASCWRGPQRSVRRCAVSDLPYFRRPHVGILKKKYIPAK